MHIATLSLWISISTEDSWRRCWQLSQEVIWHMSRAWIAIAADNALRYCYLYLSWLVCNCQVYFIRTSFSTNIYFVTFVIYLSDFFVFCPWLSLMRVVLYLVALMIFMIHWSLLSVWHTGSPYSDKLIFWLKINKNPGTNFF